MTGKASKRLKISELAKRTGLAPSAIKHWVSLGLLPPPVKTGRTMAYYDPASVDRIELIKRLKTEKFLPLDVIKRVLDSGRIDEDEFEIGRALARTEEMLADGGWMTEDQASRRTGYSIETLHHLEDLGLLNPTDGPDGKYYDAVDLGVADAVRKREALGLPFEFAAETMKLYRDGLEALVRADVRRYVGYLMTDAPTKRALQTIREGDEHLDRFILLIRQKLLRLVSHEAIAQADQLKSRLARINFLPVRGVHLPDRPPRKPVYRAAWLFLTGDFGGAAAFGASEAGRASGYGDAAVILGHLLAGRSDRAAASARSAPAVGDPLTDTAAALAFATKASEMSGFSGPMTELRQALDRLGRARSVRRPPGPWGPILDYVQGGLLTALPDIFDTGDLGRRLLSEVDRELRTRRAPTGRAPRYLARTLHTEVFPEILIGTNLLLAENPDGPARADGPEEEL